MLFVKHVVYRSGRKRCAESKRAINIIILIPLICIQMDKFSIIELVKYYEKVVKRLYFLYSNILFIEIVHINFQLFQLVYCVFYYFNYH